MDILEQIAQYIELSQAAIQEAADQLEKQAAAEERIEKEVPQVVEALVQADLIQPNERKVAADVLKDHAQTLELVRRLTARAQPAPSSMGKVASPQGRERYIDAEKSPYVTLRRRQPTLADALFYERFGLGEAVS